VRNRFILSLLAVLIGSSPVFPTSYSQSSFPVEVRDLPELDRFPEAVTGYRRGEIIAYAPKLSSFSVAYNRYDTQLQNAVTIYFAPRLNDTATQLLDEKKAVVNAHPDSRVVSERTLILRKDGRTYEATLFTFEYTESFAGRGQKVRSFLLVTFSTQRRVKVRSTAPIEQGDEAERMLVPFLDGVSWAR
jgi:hypothetical protein